MRIVYQPSADMSTGSNVAEHNGRRTNWFDWKTAVSVGETQIEDMINEAYSDCMEKVEAKTFPAFSYIATGDCVVIATCYSEHSSVHVEVLKPLHSAYIDVK